MIEVLGLDGKTPHKQVTDLLKFMSESERHLNSSLVDYFKVLVELELNYARSLCLEDNEEFERDFTIEVKGDVLGFRKHSRKIQSVLGDDYSFTGRYKGGSILSNNTKGIFLQTKMNLLDNDYEYCISKIYPEAQRTTEKERLKTLLSDELISVSVAYLVLKIFVEISSQDNWVHLAIVSGLRLEIEIQGSCSLIGTIHNFFFKNYNIVLKEVYGS